MILSVHFCLDEITLPISNSAVVKLRWVGKGPEKILFVHMVLSEGC